MHLTLDKNSFYDIIVEVCLFYNPKNSICVLIPKDDHTKKGGNYDYNFQPQLSFWRSIALQGR